MTNAENRIPPASSDPPSGPCVPLTGVVLAGGQSSRLGHDKALVRLIDGGSPDLLARTVALLHCICPRVLVVGREHPGYECRADLKPGNGPVGGVATALEIVHGPCLILSCDLPFMEERTLRRLSAARERRPPGTLVTSYRHDATGHIEPLVAIYEAGALPYYQNCVAKGLLKNNLVIPREFHHYIYYGIADALPFFNINYPADLEKAREMAHDRQA